ncbi:MAG TPA: tetratricopeptide repeat protein [Pyrinomonadaceae bacterium]|nr:tetratricopeptide repeat protein [Pyrinomonadaceae bacterium]
MSDLIKALINVKDPFALLAFLSVVLLLMLRVKAVPALFFGLLKDKLTKDKFAFLLHRVMIYGLVVFVLLAGLAVVGQILAYKTKAQPATLAEIQTELQSTTGDDGAKQKALQQYQNGLALIDQNKFDEAIESLKASLQQVQTLSAEYTLAYLYERQNKPEEARQHAAKAQELAQQQGSSLSQVKTADLSREIAAKSAAPPPVLSADKHALPMGGDSLERAVRISPGAYLGQEDWPKKYFSIALRANQTVKITFITSDDQPDMSNSTVRFYDRDESFLIGNYTSGRKSKGIVEYKVTADGTYFLSLEGRVRGTDYVISVQ